MYKIVFSDFDGTLTEAGGRLGQSFQEVIDLLKSLDSELIIVSGRSVSWGHFFLTHFPLRYAIMEGGGVILEKKDDGMIYEEILVSDDDMLSLNEFTFKLARTEIRDFISADSYGRKTDQALEIYSMPDELVLTAENMMREDAIQFSKSNVHLNYWAGEVSKAKAVKHFLNNYSTVDSGECVYFGDALNDESMFEFFENSVGVSNIAQYLDKMKTHPKVVLEGEENSYAHGVLNFLQNNP